MLSIALMTNEVCIVYSVSSLLFASSGNTVWLCLSKVLDAWIPIIRGEL